MLPENSVLEALTSRRGEEQLPASASCCRVPNDLDMTLTWGQEPGKRGLPSHLSLQAQYIEQSLNLAGPLLVSFHTPSLQDGTSPSGHPLIENHTGTIGRH